MAEFTQTQFDQEFTLDAWRLAREEGGFVRRNPSTGAVLPGTRRVCLDDWTWKEVPEKDRYRSSSERAMKRHTHTIIRFIRKQEGQSDG